MRQKVTVPIIFSSASSFLTKETRESHWTYWLWTHERIWERLAQEMGGKGGKGSLQCECRHENVALSSLGKVFSRKAMNKSG